VTSLGFKSHPAVELKELRLIFKGLGWEPPFLYEINLVALVSYGLVLQKWGPAFCQGHRVLELGFSLCNLFHFKAHIKASQISEAFKMEVASRDCKLV